MAVERIEFTVGDVVRKLRIKRGLTSHELAIKAEIAQSTLSVIERRRLPHQQPQGRRGSGRLYRDAVVASRARGLE